MKVFFACERSDRSARELQASISDALFRAGIEVWEDSPIGARVRGPAPDYGRSIVGSDIVIGLISAGTATCLFVQELLAIAAEHDKRVVIVKPKFLQLPSVPARAFPIDIDAAHDAPAQVLEFIRSNAKLRFFLSYCHRDESWVSPLLDLARRSIHDLWVDRSGLHHGAPFPDEILHAIDEANRFLLLWSQRARESRWVEREWNHAYKLSKRILPILLDSTPLPMVLEKIHSFDSVYDRGLRRLFGSS